ncbi:MAG: hypothetical protein AMXMBFR48_17060 [Ignavibacteriales bacterium]
MLSRNRFNWFPFLAIIFLILLGFVSGSCGFRSADTEVKTENFTTNDSTQKQSGDYMVKVQKTDEEWKNILTEEQYYVLRQKGTERAFTGEYEHHKEKGIYACAGCGAELFSSEMKYDSGCGWPAFFTKLAGEKIIEQIDRSFGMVRTEILCAACGGHLGHVFDDGPQPTGLRYCVNSVSLKFIRPEKK